MVSRLVEWRGLYSWSVLSRFFFDVIFFLRIFSLKSRIRKHTFVEFVASIFVHMRFELDYSRTLLVMHWLNAPVHINIMYYSDCWLRMPSAFILTYVLIHAISNTHMYMSILIKITANTLWKNRAKQVEWFVYANTVELNVTMQTEKLIHVWNYTGPICTDTVWKSQQWRLGVIRNLSMSVLAKSSQTFYRVSAQGFPSVCVFTGILLWLFPFFFAQLTCRLFATPWIHEISHHQFDSQLWSY